MSKRTDFKYDDLLPALEQALAEDLLSKGEIETFEKNKVWLSMVKSFKGTIVLTMNLLTTEEDYKMIRQYQHIIYDLKRVINTPSAMLKALEVKSKEKENDS